MKVEKILGKFGKTGLLEHKQVQKETVLGVRKDKRSLLACHTLCKCSMGTICYLVKVKLGIKVMKLMKSLIGMEVSVAGRGSECHLTFVRGKLYIAEKDPRIGHKLPERRFQALHEVYLFE